VAVARSARATRIARFGRSLALPTLSIALWFSFSISVTRKVRAVARSKLARCESQLALWRSSLHCKSLIINPFH
jgi:hypothetical protein